MQVDSVRLGLLCTNRRRCCCECSPGLLKFAGSMSVLRCNLVRISAYALATNCICNCWKINYCLAATRRERDVEYEPHRRAVLALAFICKKNIFFSTFCKPQHCYIGKIPEHIPTGSGARRSSTFHFVCGISSAKEQYLSFADNNLVSLHLAFILCSLVRRLLHHCLVLVVLLLSSFC